MKDQAIQHRFNFETLSTERLILRKLTPADYNYIFENYSEGVIRAFLGIQTDAEYLKEKYKYENGYATYNRSMVYFQLVEKETEQVIGGCGFHNWYMEHHRAELGYSINDESFKQKGLMSEVLPVIIDYGFRVMHLHRIEALTANYNIASQKLLKKNHFQQEGLLREHYLVDNVYEDSIMFSLLRKEYQVRLEI